MIVDILTPDSGAIAFEDRDNRSEPLTGQNPRSDRYQRLPFTTPGSTFIKISEGCDMTCCFCSIPMIREPYRSRPIVSILKEAEHLEKYGVEELNLISQNSTYFGKDNRPQSQLPVLLKEISGFGFHWLRVLYLMPEEITPEILESFAGPSILPYFDLPFQHVSARILKKMQCGGNFKKKYSWYKKSEICSPKPFCAAPSLSVSRARKKMILNNCWNLPPKPQLKG